MALVTRADVLEQLGLTDDTNEQVALALGVDTSGDVTSVQYAVGSDNSTLTVTITGGADAGAHTFTAGVSPYATIGELVTGIMALEGPEVEAGVPDSEPASPLEEVSVTVNAGIPDFVGKIRFDSVGVSTELSSFIDTAITQAEARACTTTYRKTISQAAVSERVSGGDVLIFSSPSVQSATIKRVDIDGTVLETLSATSYYIDPEAGIAHIDGSDGYSYGGWHEGVAPTPARNRRRSGGFSGARYPNWLLEYTGGYTTATVPADLLGVLRQHAIDIVLSRRLNRRLVSGAVLSTNQTYRSEQEMFAQHTIDLMPWMRPEGVVG